MPTSRRVDGGVRARSARPSDRGAGRPAEPAIARQSQGAWRSDGSRTTGLRLRWHHSEMLNNLYL